jgi:TolB-like protein/Tfp pilus assembly protein PilF
MPALDHGFRLNGRAVRPASGEVEGPTGQVRVEPKAMAVLLTLAEAAGKVVSREALVQAVWPRGFVTDDVLTRCIGQLRRALGDSATAPLYLETIPRRGYRLVCRIERGSSERHEIPGTPAGTLLVLPFQDLTAESETYLADGLTELLICRLSSLQQVRVISRTTAMRYRNTTSSLPEIAAQVGATWIVEGSMLRAANRVQVVAQFIEAETDAHLWAETYIRDLSDLLVLQNEIAERVASSIKRTLKRDGAPVRPAARLTADALRQYLRCRQLISRRSPDALREALATLRDVARASPDYAPLWSSVAEVQFMLMHYGEEPPARMRDACRESLDRALSLDPDDPQALGFAGILELMVEWQPAKAFRTLARALELRPSFTLAMLGLANASAVTGRFAEAEAWMRHSLETDPLDIGLNMNLGDHLILQERFGEAAEALARAETLAPGHRPSGLRRAWALALDGQAAGAVSALEAVRPTRAQDAHWFEYAALVHGAAGDRQAAGAALASLEAVAGELHVSAWSRARTCAAAGRFDQAVDWLRAAIQARESSVIFIGVTPAFRELREHAGFVRLLEELGANSDPGGLFASIPPGT